MPMSQCYLTTQVSRRFVLETQISLTYTDVCFARPWNYTTEGELKAAARATNGHGYPMNLWLHDSGAADGNRGAAGRQSAPLGWLPLWPGEEVQGYHWGQDADVVLPLTSAAGLSLTFFYFCPKCCTFSQAGMLERGWYWLLWWVLWLPPHSECTGEWGYRTWPQHSWVGYLEASQATWINCCLFPRDSLWSLLNREKKWCSPIGITIYIPICWNQHAKLQRNLFQQIQLPNIISI